MSGAYNGSVAIRVSSLVAYQVFRVNKLVTWLLHLRPSSLDLDEMGILIGAKISFLIDRATFFHAELLCSGLMDGNVNAILPCHVSA